MQKRSLIVTHLPAGVAACGEYTLILNSPNRARTRRTYLLKTSTLVRLYTIPLLSFSLLNVAQARFSSATFSGSTHIYHRANVQSDFVRSQDIPFEASGTPCGNRISRASSGSEMPASCNAPLVSLMTADFTLSPLCFLPSSQK